MTITWRAPLSLALLASLTLVAGVACSGGETRAAETTSSVDQATDTPATDDKDKEKEEEALPVEVVTLGRGAIESVLRYSADLEAEASVQVMAEAARRVVELRVEEGDRVRRGDVLVRLDDAEQRTAVARIEGQVEKAEREHQRQKALYEQQLISEQTFVDVRTELEQLQLSLDDARRQLSYTEVRAPISGVVTARHVKLGDQVTINQHLFDIVDFDTLVARVFVPERQLYRVAVGQPVRLLSESGPGRRFEGVVDRLAPVVDPKSGTVKVTVRVPPADGVLPGMFLQVELVTAVHDDALLVPKRALVVDGDQTFVFRVDAEKRVERLALLPVLDDRDNIEVASGVDEGDRIVVAGQAGLKVGSLVRVVGDDRAEG